MKKIFVEKNTDEIAVRATSDHSVDGRINTIEMKRVNKSTTPTAGIKRRARRA